MYLPPCACYIEAIGGELELMVRLPAHPANATVSPRARYDHAEPSAIPSHTTRLIPPKLARQGHRRMRFTIDRIDHVVLNVKDVEISRGSGTARVLGMEREDFGADNRTALKFGGQKLNLRPTSADKHKWIAATDTAPGSADLCFITATAAEDVIAPPPRPRRDDRTRTGVAHRGAGTDPLGLLPRPGRQPGGSRVLPVAVMSPVPWTWAGRLRAASSPSVPLANWLDPACRHGVRPALGRAWCRSRPG